MYIKLQFVAIVYRRCVENNQKYVNYMRYMYMYLCSLLIAI